MKYTIYTGCTAPIRAQNYEIAARKVAELFGIELVDSAEFQCCGYPLKAVNSETTELMAARNLAIAEKLGNTMLTLCSACTGVVTEVNHLMMHDPEAKKRINAKLKEIGLEIKEGVIIKHFTRMLYEDVGLDAIKAKITTPLTGLRFAAHYGCHYLKPSDAYEGFDDPEDPHTLDDLIRVTGAESVDYMDKKKCCGGGILAIKEETAQKIAKVKLDHIKAVGADAIVLHCPFCNVMYEGNQKNIEKKFEVEYGLPVLYYPQVLGLAMGLEPDVVALNQNRIKAKDLLTRIPAPA